VRGALTDKPGSYLDSVALVDRELGMLRRAIEEAGQWDRTAILVSSDHGWRTSTWRGGTTWTAEDEAVAHQDTSGVPFVLKLPGQKTGLAFGKSFNTVLTRQVITAILNGQLSDPAAVPAFIESADPR
jgi:membrane-anchored protein YejM (alkaline phosphatase superfamily)